MTANETGVWLAHYDTLGHVLAFADELSALRHANENVALQATFVPFHDQAEDQTAKVSVSVDDLLTLLRASQSVFVALGSDCSDPVVAAIDRLGDATLLARIRTQEER